MPDETKKQKGKNEPKDQRRRRQGRQPAAQVEKKLEKQPEVPKEPEKPAYEPPGPEFYKNLKRETDEILKITEEANLKYKRKEIQSNWAKYEMPVVTYEEIDELEDMGADYEKLIEASMSSGGHFQFKHEKSWGTDSGPSIYDKYFDINMNLLSLAVSTIPFYERNGIEESVFNENDISNMNHRATKFKQKYYNDNTYNTPELEVQEKILKNLNDECDINMNDDNHMDSSKTDDNIFTEKSQEINENMLNKSVVDNVVETTKLVPTCDSPVKVVKELNQEKETNLRPKDIDVNKIDPNIHFEDEEFLFGNKRANEKSPIKNETEFIFTKVEPSKDTKVVELEPKVTKEVPNPKNPIIESPEDLEKWLDDFLDG